MDRSSFAAPVPRSADHLDGLVQNLVALRAWAGNPSFAALAADVGELRERTGRPGGRPGKVTVYDCFRTGRSRIDGRLFRDLVEVLGVPVAQRDLWWQAYATATGSPVPQVSEGSVGKLPLPRSALVGRENALAGEATAPGGSLVVVQGPPGSGKTEFGIHLAHSWAKEARSHGSEPRQVALNLRGFDAGHAPLSPGAMLSSLLRGIGVPGALADWLDDERRAKMLRRAAGDTPVVVLLDNVGGADQLGPLLPLPPTWRVVATTRRHFPALSGGEGVRVLGLGHLGLDAGLALLSSVIGVDRVAAEPEAAARIVQHCGGMPLDLSLAAASIAESQDWTLDDHVERFTQMQGDELSRPAIDLSYQRLPEELRRSFRLLALHPGTRFTARDVAPLLGVDVATAERHLSALAHESLLSRDSDAEGGMHGIHGVLRAFALQQGRDADPRSRRAAGLTRWADGFVDDVRARTATPDIDPAWFERRFSTFVGLTEVAALWSLGEQLGDVALAMFDYFNVTGELSLSAELLRRALPDSSDAQQVPLRRSLARVLELSGDLDAARALVEELLARDLPDSEHDQQTYANVLRRSGHMTKAVRHYRLAAQRAATTGNAHVEGRALGNLGNALRMLGHFDLGTAVLAKAEQVARAAGDEATTALVMVHRVAMLVTRGDHEGAVVAGRAAIEHSEDRSLTFYLVDIRLMVVRALIDLGRFDEAEEDLVVVRDLAEHAGMLECQLEGLIHQGRLNGCRGNLEAAEAALRQVVRTGTDMGAMIVVEAHYGLGRLALGQGRLDEAEAEFGRSLELAHERGVWVEIDQARQGLDDVAQRRLGT